MKWYHPLLFLAVGLILAFVPTAKEILDFPAFYLIFLYFIFFWVTQASSWNMLSGYSGYFSFGQGAFYGIGVYTTASLIHRTDIPFILTLPLGGLLAVVVALFVGVIVFRLRQLRGELFALLTLAVDFVLAAIVLNTDFIDGGFGIPLGMVPYPEFLGSFTEMMYRLGLIIALIAVFSAFAVYHSRFGRGLFAIRDDEEIAESLGVPTFRYKLQILALSSFFAGLAGGLHALQLSYVTASAVFNLRIPLFVILMSVLGGRLHWFGPVIGAIVIHTLNDSFVGAQFEYLNQIAVGSLLIIMILFAREGIFQQLKARIVPAIIILVVTLTVAIILRVADGRLVTQLAVAMLFMIGFLLIPANLYERVSLWRKQVSIAEAPE
jgi:branched-chain amino acid transport system permease protein